MTLNLDDHPMKIVISSHGTTITIEKNTSFVTAAEFTEMLYGALAASGWSPLISDIGQALVELKEEDDNSRTDS